MPEDQALLVFTNYCDRTILNYKGKVFNFVDICSFIHSLSSLLSSAQITEILDELQLFVQKIDRPVKTKEGWTIIFS
ncbi:hypothetical protein BMETH_912_1 [methanotrophic bacterial endosymbiont of Bathymodiolus sp.]|nr:hypothetical protein BMETH_912_1 [methanotrophic bacterial endosymbiont of Bathymodiolus sp.]